MPKKKRRGSSRPAAASAAAAPLLLTELWSPLRGQLLKRYAGYAFLLLSTIVHTGSAAVDSNTYSALSLLYSATNPTSGGGGDSWISRSGWISTSTDPCANAWHGVTCNSDDTAVTMLALQANGLSGAVPTEIGYLTAMLDLHFGSNALSSTVPTEIGCLVVTTALDLASNGLTGNLPTEIGSNSEITDKIYFYENSLRGTLPTEFGMLTKLTFGFSFGQNSLSSEIPTELGAFTGLRNPAGSDDEYLTTFLIHNSFTGAIPTQLGCLTDVRKFFNLGFNHLVSTIPTELNSLTNMNYYFSLGGNNDVSGTIPTEFGLFTKLSSVLGLFDMDLSGTIPTQLGNILYTGNWLNLRSSRLSGTIPTQLGKLPMFKSAYLHDNSLTGTIPTEIGLWSEMTTMFYLEKNSLTGQIPSQLGNWTKMTDEFMLGDNFLTQSIPTEFAFLAPKRGGALTALDVSGNSELCGNYSFLKINSLTITGTALGYSCCPAGYIPVGSECEKCVPGKYSTTSYSTSCTDCEPGKYSVENATIACTDCEIGRASAHLGLGKRCPICEAGKYQDEEGKSSCTECPVGTYLKDNSTVALDHINGEKNCSVCVKGTYADGSGSYNCRSCPVGKFLRDAGSHASLHDSESDCLVCPAGTYTNRLNSSTCDDCGQGKYLADAGTNASRHDSLADCHSCDAGTHGPSTGATKESFCLPCMAGRFSPAASSSCFVCSAGEWSDDGADSCSSCAVGTYSESGASSCVICPTGRFSNMTGATSCSECAGGTVQIRTASTICRACEVGKFQPATGGSVCQACPKGTVAPSTGARSCVDCAVGKHQPVTGASQCVDCAAGKFSAAAMSTTCTGCAPGTRSLPGASSCSACKEGWHSHRASGNCSLCAAEFFLDDRAGSGRRRVACTKCPPSSEGVDCSSAGIALEDIPIRRGYYRIASRAPPESEVYLCTLGGGAACVGGNVTGDALCAEGYRGPLCSVCEAWFFLDSATGKCAPCDGAETEASVLAVWVIFLVIILSIIFCCMRYQRSSSFRHRFSAVVRSGMIMEFAPTARNGDEEATEKRKVKTNGRVEDGDKYEEHHHHQEPEQPASKSTSHDTGKWVRRATITARAMQQGPTAHMGASLLQPGEDGGVEGSVGDKGESNVLERVTRKLRILVAFCQLASSASFNLTINFPSNFTWFCSILSITSFEFFPLLPIACIFPANNFYSRLASTTLFPLLLGLLLLGLHFRSISNGGSRIFFDLLLNLLYVVLPSTSSVIVRTFKCTAFDIDEDEVLWFMTSDMSVECGEEGGTTRIIWLGYASLMMLVFPIGIPTFFATILYRHRYDLCPRLKERGFWYIFARQREWGDGGDRRSMEAEERVAHLAFLTDSYEIQLFWFEVVECCRRLMLSSMLILFDAGGGNSVAQIVAAMGICLFTIRIYAYYKPYDDDDDDLLAETAQWQYFTILFVALLIRVETMPDDEEQHTNVGLCLIFISCLGFVMMFGTLCHLMLKEMGVRRLKGDTKEKSVAPTLSAARSQEENYQGRAEELLPAEEQHSGNAFEAIAEESEDEDMPSDDEGIGKDADNKKTEGQKHEHLAHATNGDSSSEGYSSSEGGALKLERASKLTWENLQLHNTQGAQHDNSNERGGADDIVDGDVSSSEYSSDISFGHKPREVKDHDAKRNALDSAEPGQVFEAGASVTYGDSSERPTENYASSDAASSSEYSSDGY